jgi:hypothetical protein
VRPDSAARTSPFTDRDQRLAIISEAAYFISEKRGFAAGCELDDWLAAEREIDRALAGGTESKQP